jgi:hypothetical protein
MAVRMQQRRATAEQWLLADPVLAEGEIGLETDTSSFKIGNGADVWTELDYFETSASLAGTIDDYVPLTQKGDPLGVATLDATGNVPLDQLGNVPETDLSSYATTQYVDDEIAAIPAPDFTGYATETYVDDAVANLVDSSPAALDTLNELAAALGDDENFASTVTTALADKAPLESPTFTGTVDASGATTRVSFDSGLEFYGFSGGVTGVQQTIYPSAGGHYLFLPTETGTVALTSDLDAKAPLNQQINDTFLNYTVQASDNGKIVLPGDIETVITIPANTIPAGGRVDFVWLGTAGDTYVDFVGGSGYTLIAKDDKVRLATLGAACTLLAISDTLGVLVGGLE